MANQAESQDTPAWYSRWFGFISKHFVPILGFWAASAFGIVAILAYKDQKLAIEIAQKALIEASVANKIAYDALEEARRSFSQGYYAYELNRAQFIYEQIQNCRDNLVRN